MGTRIIDKYLDKFLHRNCKLNKSNFISQFYILGYERALIDISSIDCGRKTMEEQLDALEERINELNREVSGTRFS